MIVSKTINIKISNKNVGYYRNIGYDAILNSIMVINVKDLPKSSNFKIEIKCDYCDNNKMVVYSEYIKGNGRTCSYKCRNIKTKETCLKKYGVDDYSKTNEYKERIKETCLEKYGVDNYSKTDEFKIKLINNNLEKHGTNTYFESAEFKIRTLNTNLNKYGVKNYAESIEYRDKYKEICLEKYGVENYFECDEFKSKSKKTCLEKYGVDNYTKSESYKVKCEESSLLKYGVNSYNKSEKYHLNTKIGNDINYIKYLKDNISLFNCNKGHTFDIDVDNYHARTKNNITLCTVCYPIGDQKSIKEKELLEFIKSIYSGEIISGYRDGLEIDIYLPELNLGFEFNGLYYHSSKFKDNNYHLNKTEHFKEKRIRIIHIWEDDYDNKFEIIKSQIKSLIGLSKRIFARKCIVKEVSIKESKQFLNDGHIQGSVASSIKIGLYYNDELVSLMTFNSSEGRKKMEQGGYNLNRFCNKCGVNVVGGASKLLSYFIKNYEVKRIVSYADKDWSIGNLYEVLGFENVGGNGPDYKYIVNGCRVHKSRYKKDKLNLEDKTKTTELQEMNRRGIYRIYDCGKLKFKLSIN